MKERILKTLLCILIVPFLWMILICLAFGMLFLPLIAFIFPEKVSILKNNSCVSIFSNNSTQF